MRIRVAAALSLVSWLLIASPAGSSTLTLGAWAISSGVRVEFSWHPTAGDPGPVGAVGYDVYRREDCGPAERINADVFPRSGGPESYSFVDAPSPGHRYRYDVTMVDATRAPIFSGCSDCTLFDYTVWPALSVPAVLAAPSLDLGWAIFFLDPCAESCTPLVYVQGPGLDALRPYVGTGQVLALYGEVGTGSVEGPWIEPDHFELATCGIVPARRTTWGSLKSPYR